jgi:hypothetical protein
MNGVNVRRKKYGACSLAVRVLKETERRYKNCAGLFLVFSCIAALIFGCVRSSFLSLFPLLLFFWPEKRQLKY